MRLYKVTYIHEHEGTCYEWFPLKAEADAKRKELNTERGDDDYAYVSEVNIPTSSRRLLAEWLSNHFNRNNG